MAGRSTLAIHDGNQPRVIVVDDNPVNCAMVRAILEKERIRVDVAHSGEEALEEIRRVPYDLILLDIEMPGLSGFDVLRELRDRQAQLAFLPIVLLTGKTDQESRVSALEAGATDFLTKPFDPPELGARIRNHIGAKRLYDKLMMTNHLLQEERAKVFEAQLALLPDSLPDRPGLRFGRGYRPSSMASGDYYDVINRPDGRVLIAMADVSGHGIAAAMRMSILRSVLHSGAAAGHDIEVIMQSLNRILQHGLDEYSFVTFYLAEFDPLSGLLRSVSAGHHAPIIQNSATGQAGELPILTTYPLGIEAEIELQISEVTLSAHHRLVFYTDGLVEQTNAAGEFFELENIYRTLEATRGLRPQAAVDRLLHTHAVFSGTETPSDDVTILIMDVTERGATRP